VILRGSTTGFVLVRRKTYINWRFGMRSSQLADSQRLIAKHFAITQRVRDQLVRPHNDAHVMELIDHGHLAQPPTMTRSADNTTDVKLAGEREKPARATIK